MKRIFSLVLPLLLWLCPLILNANQATLYNGTSISAYVPMMANWSEDFVHSQFVIPATTLATNGITGGTAIDVLDFYTNYNNGSWGNTIWAVRIREVSTSTCTDMMSTAGATLVYRGNLAVQNGLLHIPFSQSYNYNGSNLLVDIRVEQTANTYINLRFYGMDIANGSVSQRNPNVAVIPHNFLPKVTIQYSSGSAACAAPTNVVVSQITSSSAVLTWDEPIPNANYQYLYVPAGQNVDWSAARTAYAPRAQLLGLAANTTYECYVRTLCDDNATSTGIRVPFTTECLPYSLPWSETFEGTVDWTCWHKPLEVNIDNGYYYGGSGMALVFGRDNNGAVVVLPPFGDINNKRLTMMVRTGCSFNPNQPTNIGHLSIGYVTDANQAETFVPLQEVPFIYENNVYIPVDYIGLPADARMAMRYDGHDNMNIGETWVDNLLVEELSACPSPTDLRITDITTSTIDLQWTPAACSDTCLLQLISGASVLYRDTFVGSTCTVSGLQPGTFYQLTATMQTLCDGILSAETYSLPLVFQTDCRTLYEDDLPFTEDFEGEHLLNMPNCWQALGGHITGMFDHFDRDVYAGAQSLRLNTPFNGVMHTAVLPRMDLEWSYMQLQFAYKADTEGSLEVGYVTNPDGASEQEQDWHLIRLLHPAQYNVYQVDTIHLDCIPAGAHHVVFRCIGGRLYGNYVDNIVISERTDIKRIVHLQLSEDSTCHIVANVPDTILKNDTILLTAVPAPHYEFISWSDGNTDNPRTLLITKDTTLSAICRLEQHSIRLDGEYVTLEGAGVYSYGDTALISCTPMVGYRFLAWSDGMEDNPRALVVTMDTTLYAQCLYMHGLEADSITTDADQVRVLAGNNSATFVWPLWPEVATYSLFLTKDQEVVVKIVFDEDGHVMSSALQAPGTHSGSARAAAEEMAQGWLFRIEGLVPESLYSYNLHIKNAAGKTLKVYSGSFRTIEEATALEEVIVDDVPIRIWHDGHLYIRKHGHTYTITGECME